MQDNVKKAMYQELRHALAILTNAEELLRAEGTKEKKDAEKLEKISSELLHFITDMEKEMSAC